MVEFSKELKGKIRIGARRWLDEKCERLDFANAAEQFRASIGYCSASNACDDSKKFYAQIVRHLPRLNDDEQDVLLAASQTDLRPFFAVAALAIAGDSQAQEVQP